MFVLQFDMDYFKGRCDSVNLFFVLPETANFNKELSNCVVIRLSYMRPDAMLVSNGIANIIIIFDHFKNYALLSPEAFIRTSTLVLSIIFNLNRYVGILSSKNCNITRHIVIIYSDANEIFNAIFIWLNRKEIIPTKLWTPELQAFPSNVSE